MFLLYYITDILSVFFFLQKYYYIVFWFLQYVLPRIMENYTKQQAVICCLIMMNAVLQAVDVLNPSMHY